VKERSYRGIVQPRKVVPRFVVPKSNSVEYNRQGQTPSNYQDAFSDEFWPDMWYFVSISNIFF